MSHKLLVPVLLSSSPMEGGDDSGLPAGIWASILSTYCSYKDLRSCIAVNSFFRNYIPPLIERLYVFDARELHRVYASKFPNVKLVYIYSLTSVPDDEEGPGASSMTLCLRTARDVVPFLECFPKLNFAHIGGYTPDHSDFVKIAMDGTHNDLSYFRMLCNTEGHQAAFRGMLQSFCESFERGSLGDNLQLSGIFDAPWFQEQLDCSRDRRCQLCPRICQTFPLGFAAVRGSLDICTPERERLLCVYRRDGEYFRNSNVLEVLLSKYSLGMTRLKQPLVEERPGVLVLQEKVVMAYEFEEQTLEKMEFLCRECGCDASRLSPESIHECLTHFGGQKFYMKRELLDRLNRIGFQLIESGFSIISDRDFNSSH